MQKRYLPIMVCVVILAIVAVAGYLRPAATEEMPRRILFDSSGGKVIFSHLEHEESYVNNCATCHHESADPGADPVKCGKCHPPEFTPEFVADHSTYFTDEQHCARCHHAEFTGLVYNHDEHAELYAADCTDCHHDTDIEPEPMDCGECHMDTGDEAMPSKEVAVHERCSMCHQDVFDEELAGCSYCHETLEAGKGDAMPATTTCSQCHEKGVEQLIPPRMKAFHDGCMGCHEEMQAGPFEDDQCNQCHMPR